MASATPKKKMEPIVFTLRGTAPDTKLEVFGQEFHVHSAISKQQSAFFFKFMDSPDKEPVINPGKFSYEYVTKIDGDDWSLGAASDTKNPVGNPSSIPKIKRKNDTACFKKLINAFYGLPYVVLDLETLRRITEIADYYCALPVIARTLLGALFQGPYKFFISPDNAAELLNIALKLRQPDLFKDCMTLVLGPWASPQWHRFETGVLRRSALIYSEKIKAMIGAAHQNLLEEQSKGKYNINLDITNDLTRIVGPFGGKQISMPEYYRKLYEQVESGFRYPSYPEGDFELEFFEVVELCENTLKLNPEKVSGKDDYLDYFLCVRIADEHLPWDSKQMDW